MPTFEDRVARWLRILEDHRAVERAPKGHANLTHWQTAPVEIEAFLIAVRRLGGRCRVMVGYQGSSNVWDIVEAVIDDVVTFAHWINKRPRPSDPTADDLAEAEVDQAIAEEHARIRAGVGIEERLEQSELLYGEDGGPGGNADDLGGEG